MDKMYKKFLDKYVGDTFAVVKAPNTSQFSVISNKGELVLYFHVVRSLTGVDNFHLFRGNELCATIGASFGLDDDESMRVVRDWFGDMLAIKKVSDLSSFISE